MFSHVSLCPQEAEMYTPGRQSLGQTPPPADTSLEDTHLGIQPPEADTLLGRHPLPQADTLPGQTPTPCRHPRQTSSPHQTAIAADGTHPTGMHSCYTCIRFNLLQFTSCVLVPRKKRKGAFTIELCLSNVLI